jgi:hypothetical protein
MGDAGGVLIGQQRPYANQFVAAVQNPFQKRIAAIVDPLGTKRASGTLSYDDVIQAQKDLEAEIAAFETTASQFEGFGKSQATVVRQARKTLYGDETGKAQPGSIIQSWRDTFTNDLATLKPPPKTKELGPPSEEPPSLETILTGSTPRKKAEGAAEQQRKRAMAARGHAGTVLTGGQGAGKVPMANRSYKSILGGY